jgi:hypothetical protein
MAFYRVGLGTTKTNPDVIAPVNVGLTKSKYIFLDVRVFTFISVLSVNVYL